ncbi:MAG: hypothetical protein JSR81_16130 [Proteobacteria bacterium]|nr:hypothetical protein [Pseudomonadota bacterium]
MADDIAGYKAIAKLYNAMMTGLVLTLVSQKSADAARDFMFAHFRKQHLEKFLPGLKKLGLDALPDAVACAQYHYFSNALGGVKTEYVRESDRKAWVRYPPPRWIWQGTAICAIPREVNEAMLHGWHGHNGVSLGNPRLGFVCTGQTPNGDPGLEGYYFEYDHAIAPEERVRFAPDEHMPRFDARAAPKLDSASWPQERLRKVERSYAMEYVRSFLPVTQELFGADEAERLVAKTARLIGLQFYEETAAMLGIAGDGAADFARYLCALQSAQGERADAADASVTQQGWRLMDGVTLAEPDAAFRAWNALWDGALAAHNRDLRLKTERSGQTIRWHIAAA